MKEIFCALLVSCSVIGAAIYLDNKQQQRDERLRVAIEDIRSEQLTPIRDAVRKTAGEKAWILEQMDRKAANAQSQREADRSATQALANP